MSDPRWCIGERHPEYGVVQAMGVTGGEAYRWFVADDGVVTMIPLSMLEDASRHAPGGQR